MYTLEALGGFSRDEHERITGSRLVRKRKQARQKAGATGGVVMGLGGRQDVIILSYISFTCYTVLIVLTYLIVNINN